jgi:hypothetical protein
MGVVSRQKINYLLDWHNKEYASFFARRIRRLEASPANRREIVAGSGGHHISVDLAVTAQEATQFANIARTDPGFTTTVRSAASNPTTARLGVVGSGTFLGRYTDNRGTTWTTFASGMTSPQRIRRDSVGGLFWVGDANGSGTIGMASSPDLATAFTVYDTGSTRTHVQFDVNQTTGTVLSAARDGASINIRVVRRPVSGSWSTYTFAVSGGTTGAICGVACNEFHGTWVICIEDSTNSLQHYYVSVDDGLSFSSAHSLGNTSVGGVSESVVSYGPLVLASEYRATGNFIHMSLDGGLTWDVEDPVSSGDGNGNAHRLYVANDSLYVSGNSGVRLFVP